MTTEAENKTPRATVIITPRERFGVARESLESLLAETGEPYDLVYVDAGGPRHLSAWIAGMAAEHGFTHLQPGRMLTPNGARNAGIAVAKTPYVVFADNDVIFSPGWLKALCDCADEGGADVVAPMTCEGPELHAVIHQAGGKYAEDRHAFFAAPAGERHIVDLMPLQGERLDALPAFERGEIDTCEFHCVLARRDLFDRIGPLDERMLATKEHLDFCMSVHKAGGTVMIEPASVVTYLFPTRQHAMKPADFPFFLVRWSNDWQQRSLDHFRDKWGVAEDDYFLRRYDRLGWRRREGVVKTLAKMTPVLGKNRLYVRGFTKALDPVAWAISKVLVARQDRAERTAKRSPLPPHSQTSSAPAAQAS